MTGFLYIFTKLSFFAQTFCFIVPFAYFTLCFASFSSMSTRIMSGPIFYNPAPRNKHFKLPSHAAHPLCRSRHNQRLDASVALVKIQIPHISQALAVIYVDDLFPRQILTQKALSNT